MPAGRLTPPPPYSAAVPMLPYRPSSERRASLTESYDVSFNDAIEREAGRAAYRRDRIAVFCMRPFGLPTCEWWAGVLRRWAEPKP